MPKKLTLDYVKSFIESQGYQLLSESYKNNFTPLKVKCPNNHIYYPTFGNFYKGQRCSVCFKTIKHDYEYVKSFIEKNGHVLLSETYENAHTKLLIKCPIGHISKISFNKIQQGQSLCYICSGKHKHTYGYVKSFIESQGYQLLSETYENAHEKLLLKCPIGHEYKTKFNYFQQGNRCPICAGNKKFTYDYVKNYIESQGYQLLSDTYKNNRTKLLLKCPIGHDYKTIFGSFKNGNRCPICNGNKKFTYDYVKNFIELEGYQLLSDDYINSSEKLLLKCPIGHDFLMSFYHFKKGIRCPLCNAEKQTSKGEQDLALYIESLSIQVIRNDRSIIINPLTGKNLELDIYIPSLNKAIEYNGLYWHSDDYQKVKDKIKAKECKKLNIDLLIVKDYNWINNNDLEKNKIKKFLTHMK